MKSFVLYDYARAASRDWGLLEKDKKRGDYARPAVFVVGPDHKVAHAWTGERPKPEEILAKVSEITGLPRPSEEPPRPKEADKSDAAPGTAKKLSAEERERIKAERRAAREAGKSLKTGEAPAPGAAAEGEEAPKKLSAEERERIKAERRAAREAGKSVKTGASAPAEPAAEPTAETTEQPAEAPRAGTSPPRCQPRRGRGSRPSDAPPGRQASPSNNPLHSPRRTSKTRMLPVRWGMPSRRRRTGRGKGPWRSQSVTRPTVVAAGAGGAGGGSRGPG
jgi:hypothetical protein